MNGQSWKVVGGVGKGGILVREGSSTSSAELEERLATGAVVLQEERAGERLRYKKLSGAGPESGWVSLALKGKVLLEKVADEPATDHQEDGTDSVTIMPEFVPSPPPVPNSRKPRVLLLGGTGHNEKVIRAQFGMLLGACKADLDFCFVVGRCPAQESHFGVQAVRKMYPHDELFQYTPFYPDEQREALGSYADIDGAIETIEEAIKQHEPIDALLGFSMGSNLATVIAARSCLGISAPLHCVVHLSPAGFPPDFLKQVPSLFTKKLPIPALVSHGVQEPFPVDWIADLYTSAELDEHSEGHRPLPGNASEGRALSRRIRDFILQKTGRSAR